MEDLLTALSKDSVQSGGLEQYALRTRLDTLLRQELVTASSDVVEAIVNVLKVKSGLSGVTPAEVVAHFHALNTNAGTPLPSPQPSSALVTPAVVPVTVSTSSPTDGYTLPELVRLGDAIGRRKPHALTSPDGTVKKVSDWRDVAEEIIQWLNTRGKIPQLPFYQPGSAKIRFVDEKRYGNGKRYTDHRRLIINSKTMFIYVNIKNDTMVKCLNALCDEVGESPAGFRVTLQ